MARPSGSQAECRGFESHRPLCNSVIGRCSPAKTIIYSRFLTDNCNMVSIARKQGREQKIGRGVAIVVFVVFAIAGAGMLYPLGIRPVLKAFASGHWQQTPCRIITAEVGSHSDSDGTTYSIDITYEYQFAGGTYRSSKYYFSSGSSSGYSNKARIVNEYKTAANPVCFVNPDNPSEAVLVRGFRAGLLFALFPAVFLVIGVGGVVLFLKKPALMGVQQKVFKTQQELATDVLRVTDSPSGPVILKPKFSPKAKLIGSIIVAVFWNGIVSVAIVKITEAWRAGSGEWTPTLLIIPFAAVGLLLIGMVIYCLLASFNPRPTLILNSAQIPTGGTVHLDWHIAGRVDRLQTLSILLRAKEEARYRAGKNQHTDTNIFFRKEIFSASSPDITSTGQADFDIPADTMHSFEAANNKILWEIAVKGGIEKWPDINEEFKITIVPAQAQQI
jgi:hypothetical protein